MLASLFTYLSWLGYVMLILTLAFLVLGLFMIERVNRRLDPDRIEKTIRYLGVMFLFGTLGFMSIFADWAVGHGFIYEETGFVTGISEASLQVLTYGTFGGSVCCGVLLAISTIMRHRRVKTARIEYADMYKTLCEEYGAEAANTLMEQAGH